MLTELVKALEEKKSILERELAAIREQQAHLDAERQKLAREAEEREHALAAISEQAVKKYTVLWRSYTPPNPFPCPYCFVLQKKISPLEPHHRLDDVAPFQCRVCGEIFEIPVELLYA